MTDDDLRRRLEKLVALRDHPSTLPAIREEAQKAYERIINNKARQGETSSSPLHFHRGFGDFELSQVQQEMMRMINRETEKIWKGIRPKASDVGRGW